MTILCTAIIYQHLRFNQGEGQEENAIVTSTWPFVVAWDFKKVKKGLLDRYEIKKYEDHVVQDNFKFGDDKEIVCHMSLSKPINMLTWCTFAVDCRLAE